MAKRKKPQSKRKQTERYRKTGLSYSQINRLSDDEKRKIDKYIIAEEKTAKKKKRPPNYASIPQKIKRDDVRGARISKKRHWLEANGFPQAMVRGAITDNQIDSIRLQDLDNDRIRDKREQYPFLFGIENFDFDRVYHLKEGNRLFVAFRDYQGELDFETILKEFSNRSNSELLSFLESINAMPETYQRGVSGSSSGRAGDYKFQIAPQSVIESFNNEAKLETRKDKRRLANMGKAGNKRKRGHFKGETVGFQVLKNGRRVSHAEVTPRNLLIIANAIMHNVTEKDRKAFYQRFYTDIVRNVPDMETILPRPM